MPCLSANVFRTTCKRRRSVGPPGLLTSAHSVHGRAGNSSWEVQCVPGAMIPSLGSKYATLRSFDPLPIWKHMETQEFPASRSHKFPRQIERTRWRLLQLTTAQYCRSDYRLPSSKPVGWFGRLINVVPSSVLLFFQIPNWNHVPLSFCLEAIFNYIEHVRTQQFFLPFSPHAGCNAALTFALQNASAAIPGHSPSNSAFDFGKHVKYVCWSFGRQGVVSSNDGITWKYMKIPDPEMKLDLIWDRLG